MRKIFALLASLCLFVSMAIASPAQHQHEGGLSAQTSVRLTLVVPETESMTVVPQNPDLPASATNPYVATVKWNLENAHTPASVVVAYAGNEYQPQCENDDHVVTNCRPDTYSALQTVQIVIPWHQLSPNSIQNFELRIS